MDYGDCTHIFRIQFKKTEHLDRISRVSQRAVCFFQFVTSQPERTYRKTEAKHAEFDVFCVIFSLYGAYVQRERIEICVKSQRFTIWFHCLVWDSFFFSRGNANRRLISVSLLGPVSEEPLKMKTCCSGGVTKQRLATCMTLHPSATTLDLFRFPEIHLPVVQRTGTGGKKKTVVVRVSQKYVVLKGRCGVLNTSPQ